MEDEHSKKLTEAEKMEAVVELATTTTTMTELAERYGVTKQAVNQWKDKFLPETITLQDAQKMTNAELEKAFERNATLAKLVAIQRVSVLIPKEKDVDKLTRLIKELRGMGEIDLPKGAKAGPWSIQVNQAIQNINKQKTIVNNGTGKHRIKRDTA